MILSDPLYVTLIKVPDAIDQENSPKNRSRVRLWDNEISKSSKIEKKRTEDTKRE